MNIIDTEMSFANEFAPGPSNLSGYKPNFAIFVSMFHLSSLAIQLPWLTIDKTAKRILKFNKNSSWRLFNDL